MAEGEAEGTIRGKAKRRLLGLARGISWLAKAMAAGGALVFGGIFAAFPEGEISVALSFLVLGATGALLASPLVGLLGMAFRLGGRRREGALRRASRGLFLQLDDGRTRFLGAGVESCVVAPTAAGPELHIGLSDGNEISILVADESTAERLLDMFGVGHERRRTRVRWANSLGRIAAGALGFTITLVAGLTVALSVPEPFGVPALLLAVVAPFISAGLFSELLAWREIEVGTDGIAWRFHGRRKLVPLRDVARVEARGDHLVVGLVDGSERCFVVSRAGFAEGLRRRIESVLSAMGGARGKQAFFARGELGFSEWTERMRNLLAKGTSLRELPVDPSDAVRVLEDPDAEPAMRVGAALALAQLGEPALAHKVRVVADTCVSPKLRIALETAAAGDVEEEVVEVAQEELRMNMRVEPG